ncbi:MAG: diacylglycerol kinase family protein [Bacteroidota bacterium]|jgi:diacylglycerol kinase (ATP)
MADDQKTWYFIVNPNAGSRKGVRDWPKISRLIRESGIQHETVLTTHREHAIDLAVDCIRQGYRRIAVVGGDGTLNEVLNGIVIQKKIDPKDIFLGMIPVGTGNDWCRSFNIPFDYKKALAVLMQEKTFVQDVGKVTHYHHDKPSVRYFMNVAGMGYDALVNKKTNMMKDKGRGGPLTYFYFVFASLFQYRFMEAVIEVDGKKVFKGEIFSMNVGICKYNGGGMMQVPFAVPDDGLLDVTLIMKAPKYMVIQHVRKLYDGSLVNLPFVKTFKGKEIRIRSTGRVFLETDGESLGHTPFTFEIIPLGIRTVVG